MAVYSTGTRGRPIVTNPPQPSDLRKIVDFAARSAFRAGPSTERLAVTGNDLFDGLHWYETDTGQTYAYDSGGWGNAAAARDAVTSGVFTPSSGWDIGTGSQYARFGVDRVQVYASFRRTGGALQTGSTGNVTNTPVGQLTVPPTWESGFSSGRSGRLAAFMVNTAGSVELVATTPGSTIATGEYLSFAGSYPYL